jgi:hypothetical protein
MIENGVVYGKGPLGLRSAQPLATTTTGSLTIVFMISYAYLPSVSANIHNAANDLTVGKHIP